MANEQTTLTEVAKDTGELIHQAGAKTTQTVLAHTEKYHDAYTTIDKIMDSFWSVYPISVLQSQYLSFLATDKLFKFFIRKTLKTVATPDKTLVLVLNRVGSTFFILFFGF